MTPEQRLADELEEAGELLAIFNECRTSENWRAFQASLRRAHMINVNYGINFEIGRPVIRVPTRPAETLRDRLVISLEAIIQQARQDPELDSWDVAEWIVAKVERDIGQPIEV
jgi:hypothetical protein